MELTLSVQFMSENTFFSVLNKSPKGLDLLYFKHSDLALAPDFINESEIRILVESVFDELKQNEWEIGQVKITIPHSSALITQFPGREGISQGEMIQLLNLDIKQYEPDLRTEDFISRLYKMKSEKRKYLLYLAFLSKRESYEQLKKLFKPFVVRAEDVETEQMNTHKSFYYNYPDLSPSKTMLLGVHNENIELSILSDKRFIYYNHLKLPEQDKFTEMLISVHQKLLTSYIDSIDNLVLWGEGLNKKHLDSAKSDLSDSIKSITRLNAFRLMSSSLGKEQRDICSRMSHLVPPLVGAALSHYNETEIIG